MEKDYSSFMQKAEDGSIQSFDEEALTRYIDSQVGQGVTSFQKKFEKAQEDAKMTEQQKLDKDRKEFEEAKLAFENEMKAKKVELISEKAKAKLSNANFSEKEIELLVKYVNDDETNSLSMIDSLIAERKNIIEENTKKAIENIQSHQPQSNTNANASKEAGQKEVTKRTSQEIKNLYK